MAMISALIYGWIIIAHLSTYHLFRHPGASEVAFSRFRFQFRVISISGLMMTVFSLFSTISVIRLSLYIQYWPFWWFWNGAWKILFLVPFLCVAFLWMPTDEFLDMLWKPTHDENSESDASASDHEEAESPPESSPSSESTPDDPTSHLNRVDLSSAEDDSYDSDESLQMFSNV